MKTPAALILGLTLLSSLDATAAPFPYKPVKPIGPITVQNLDQVVEVTPARLTNLVPQTLTRGDREFGGNGPDITCSVELRLPSDRRKVLADVHFRAVETKGDRSTTDQRWQKTVYTAPSDKKIKSLGSQTRSTVSFRSKKAGFQLLAPGEDMAAIFAKLDQFALQIADAHMKMSGLAYTHPEYKKAHAFIAEFNKGARDMLVKSNHVHNVVPSSGPVALLSIVGDTGGDDISDDANGKDDTRIEAITFKKIKVTLE